MKNYHSQSIDKCLKELETRKTGLSTEEANKRIITHGLNQLEEGKKTPLILKFLAQFKDLMIIILLSAAIISLVFGIIEKSGSEIIDASIIFGIVILNAILGFAQEHKAEKSLDALKKMTEPETMVIRDGEQIRIKTQKLCPGDIVVLEAGIIVPADLRLIESAGLLCDESSLTGESHAVEKEAEVVCKDNAVLADRKNMAFSGSVVAKGRGLGVVVATGGRTEIGKIAEIIKTTEKESTPLQKSLTAVSKVITIIVLLVAAIVFIVEVTARQNPNILEAFLTAVAIAVAAIPESMPAVITIIMSLGVSRLAKSKAIIKRLHAVETLGSCEVICSDKTGTITQNVMTVKGTYISGKLQFDGYDINNKDFRTLVVASALCNDSSKVKGKYVGDPTETALSEFASGFKLEKKALEKTYPRVFELPFDSNRKLMTTVHEVDGAAYAYVKGAVDMMVGRCTKILVNGKIKAITPQDIEAANKANKAMAGRALRVLGVAMKAVKLQSIKKVTEDELVFVGLVGMIDPPRKEVIHAVRECVSAGMRPVMITGDHKDTAFAIASEVGICKKESEVLTGAELDKLSDAEFQKRLNELSVFARVSPENKVRIVEMFKRQGKIVAMTGDGVNDAPSMKMASIGVGMGITGTDVTKEVADMIVTDDNFATIVVAVEEGRKIYDNIQKTIKFLFAANMAEILALFFATLIFPEFIFLYPVQILFVNLITDSLPAIALGLEPAEKDIMLKPPRNSKKTMFSNGVGVGIVVLGMTQTLIIFLCYMLGLMYSPEVATSMAFYSLNLIQLLFIFSARVKNYIFKSNPFKNKWVVMAVGVGIGVMALIALTPLHTVLKLVSLNFTQWMYVIGFSFLIIISSELLKLFHSLHEKYRIKHPKKEGVKKAKVIIEK